jgi:hypothetical protein
MDLHHLEESAEEVFDHALHIVKMKTLLLILIILSLAYLYLFVIE